MILVGGGVPMTVVDLAVVGSGAAGFAAAITARRRGASVVMVEAGTVGGTCVNTGCVPSKALLAAAAARQMSVVGRLPGIRVAPYAVDLPSVVAGLDGLVAGMRADRYVEVAVLLRRLTRTGGLRMSTSSPSYPLSIEQAVRLGGDIFGHLLDVDRPDPDTAEARP
jgi:mercuric reductase